MFSFVIVAAVALLASALTLFSGFGLGTLLMPVLALLFPLPLAIAATAIVHLANNLFKLALVARHANWQIVARFGIPAGLAAIAGASVLTYLAAVPAVFGYSAFGEEFEVQIVKLVVGLLIVGFAVLELRQGGERLSFSSRYVVPGGLVSGFFGGLSGNQGALRAGFLIRAGLDKHAFVGTSVVCAVIVDTLRIGVYGFAFFSVQAGGIGAGLVSTVIVAMFAAFTGAYVGVRLLDKVTLKFVRIFVAVMMIAIGLGLASGLI